MRVLLSLLVVVGQLGVYVPTAVADNSAITASSVVIAQMYPGDDDSPKLEFVEIYNNSDATVDVTGWCVKLLYNTGSTARKICLTTTGASTALLLDPGTFGIFMSNDIREKVSFVADGYFSSGISASHGHVQLVDAGGQEIDRLGWGDAVNPETTAVAALTNGKSLQRKTAGFHMQDTDDNSADFTEADPLLHASGVYEQALITDACPNIEDVQTLVPDGYLVDEYGNCQPDSCLNLDGLQISVPDGYDADTNGNCTQHDECDNVDGVQTAVPNGMVRDGSNDCRWNVLPIRLTELYPNPTGSDVGNEYVEVYNPTDTMVDLSLYTIRIGTGLDKSFTFPVGATIAPGEYRSFDNTTIKFTLVNSMSRVQLVGLDNVVYGDSGDYQDPKEGETWASINGTWQYTNRPTPSDENLVSIAEAASSASSSSGASSLKPCAPDQYRNPETNRCRKITTAISNLTPCKVGQARNPETNRCRSIATTASVTLKPCAAGQVRNLETNRCRKQTDTNVPAAAYAVQPIKDTGMAFVGWWAFGGVGLLATGYAAWEWRKEVMTFLRRLRKL